ncbi:MAG: hypothetical protein JXB62_12125 [Pirellulales bacterium]|nr:hypothetical protein [Pirellulales bacterium]
MTARRILDVITDILTLLALVFAGFGHLLPWIRVGDGGLIGIPMEFQMWHAARSGIALGAAALLVGASLAFDLGTGARKLLVLLMFAAVLTALVFQVLIFSPYPMSEMHQLLMRDPSWRQDDGFLVALVPSMIAGGLCLVRMAWTMIPWGSGRQLPPIPSFESAASSDPD